MLWEQPHQLEELQQPPTKKTMGWVQPEDLLPSEASKDPRGQQSSCEEDSDDDLPMVTKCIENGSQVKSRWEDWLDVREMPLMTRVSANGADQRYRATDWLDPNSEEEDDLPAVARCPESAPAISPRAWLQAPTACPPPVSKPSLVSALDTKHPAAKSNATLASDESSISKETDESPIWQRKDSVLSQGDVDLLCEMPYG